MNTDQKPKRPRRTCAHNIVSAAVTDATFDRLERCCAQLGAPRSLVIRDAVEIYLAAFDAGDEKPANS